jgi:polyhydroxyalkanoate synthesis regulator phasin
MPYEYEYLSVDKRIILLQQQIEMKEERLFELEMADQENTAIQQEITEVTDSITALKVKLSELEE